MNDRAEDISIHGQGTDKPPKKPPTDIRQKAKKQYLLWINEISPTKRVTGLDQITRSQLKLARGIYTRILEMEERDSGRSDEVILRGYKQLNTILKDLKRESIRRDSEAYTKAYTKPKGVGM